MDVELLDVTDDALCARAYEVIIASKGFERPWSESPSFEEMLVEWRHVDKAEPMEMWTAHDDGELVGVATIWFPLQDNTWLSWFEVQVHPEHRRRGAGSALVERLVERAEQELRTTLVAEVLVPEESDDHPYRRFLEKHGFGLNNTEVMRHLDLPVEQALLDELADQARPRWQERYRIETFTGLVPEELQLSLCAVMNRLGVDAPTGEIDFEEESLTPERLREYAELEQAQGRHRFTTLAIHQESGEVVAYTDLIVPSGAPTIVWQHGTLVHPDHRGYRLGMAVKVENLRRLQADHPERKRVVTGNDGTNSWMLSINEQLGFRIVELCPAYQLRLD